MKAKAKRARATRVWPHGTHPHLHEVLWSSEGDDGWYANVRGKLVPVEIREVPRKARTR